MIPVEVFLGCRPRTVIAMTVSLLLSRSWRRKRLSMSDDQVSTKYPCCWLWVGHQQVGSKRKSSNFVFFLGPFHQKVTVKELAIFVVVPPLIHTQAFSSSNWTVHCKCWHSKALSIFSVTGLAGRRKNSCRNSSGKFIFCSGALWCQGCSGLWCHYCWE